jgi:hypothetical protein
VGFLHQLEGNALSTPTAGLDTVGNVLAHRKTARVLFDECHSEAWTIDAETARTMQPAHPEDSSYALAARALTERDFVVAANLAGPLTAAALDGADVLVIAHPSDPKWERTTGAGEPRLAPEEIDAIDRWVAAGGGLIVLGETEQEKYGNNLCDLVARFGLGIENETVTDYERFHSAPSWVLADLQQGVSHRALHGADPLARVEAACFYRATTLAAGEDAAVIARTSASASEPGAPLVALAAHGAGRVAVLGDSDLFGDDCLDELDHHDLWLNLVYWTAGPAFAADASSPASAAAADPHWAALKAEVDALRLRQAPDGSVDTEAHDPAELRAAAERIAAAVRGLAHHFPHQAGYLDTVCDDLARWARGGFAKPDFAPSLERLRPDRDRRDGAEHLVVAPMYLQNASRDTRFEALIVRVPWPQWLSELERTRYDNPKFVPVTFVDHTAGYESECAVLFPETVSVAERPAANHFGAIFCDREAARFRRVVSRAAATLGLALPPDAAALLASAELSQDAYVLWDLIHDRAHSHGDLPFDPFMIRQRMPYWMYSLEELRCDLTAFAQAVELEREGLRFARHVQYAILFDRLFRFPITGARVRNYDGLGGQLLFAYLHKHGHLHWTDNRLSIEWARVADGVGGLRAEVEALYREGIDRSRVAHWATAHELVARYVPAATSSKWTPGARPLSDESDAKAWIDLVEDDEFPLSIFYSSLKQKLDAEAATLAA